MSTDEAITILRRAIVVDPVTLLVCCAAELRAMEREKKQMRQGFQVLATISETINEFHHDFA